MFKRLLALVFFIISLAVLANTAPTINLGADQFVLAGGNISLNASVNDPDGDELAITWKVLHSPQGSKKELSNLSGENSSLDLDRVGTFILEVTASDNEFSVSDLLTVYSVASIGNIVFGPVNYLADPKCSKRNKNICKDNTDNFNIASPGSNYTLYAQNNGYISANLNLNSSDITSFYDFSGSQEILTKSVELLASNELNTRVGGNPGATIDIFIRENLLPSDTNISPSINVSDIEYFGNYGSRSAISVNDPDSSQEHSILILRQPRNGTVYVENGEIIFIPRIGNRDNSDFVVAVFDNGEVPKAQVKKVNINFNSGNRAPLVSGSLPVSEGEVVSFSPIIDDNEGDIHTITIKALPINGLVEISGDEINFTPDQGQQGPFSFEITVTDNQSPSLSTDFLVNGQVNQNLPPVIVGSTMLQTPQGNSVSSSYTFSDPNINQVTDFYIHSDPSNGTLVFSPGGFIQYRPNPNFFGTDSFTLGARDNAVFPLETLQVIEIDVLENAPPIVFNNPRELNLNSGQSFSSGISFSDPNFGQNHTFTIVKQPVGGTASLLANTFEYNSDISFTGTDEVVIEIRDNGTPQKATLATFLFNVTGNSAPNPTIFWLGSGGNSIPSGTTRSFRINPNDGDTGQQYTYEVAVQPSNGTIIQSPFWPNQFTYQSNDSFSGIDSFQVRVIDNGIPSLQGVGSFIANVTQNNPPNPNDELVEVVAGLRKTKRLNINDPDIGQNHLFSVVNQPSMATANFISNTLLEIVADPSATGSESFQVRVADNGTPVGEGFATITINYAQNSPPTFNDEQLNFVTTESTLIGMNIPFTDPDISGGQLITAEQLTTPVLGVVNSFLVRNSRLQVSYTPNPGSLGTETLQFRITDNGIPNLNDTITVNIDIGQNSPPNPFAGTEELLQGYAFGRVFVDANDPDENQSHTYGVFANPASGSATISRWGTLIYRPDGEFFGTDQVGIIVTEDRVPFPALSGTTVAVFQVEENLPPVPSVPGTYSTFQSKAISDRIDLNDPNSRLNDSNFSGIYEWSIAQNPSNGTVEVNGAGLFTYQPSPGFSGQDTFEIEVQETPRYELPQELKGSVTVTVDVILNNPPVISYDPVMLVSGEAVSGNIEISDPDVGQFQIVDFEIVNLPDFGNLNITDNGDDFDFTYTSTSFGGNDSFDVRVFDNGVPSAESVITIPINIEENLPPDVQPASITAFQGSSGETDIVFTDPNQGQTHTFSISSAPSFGVASIDQNGRLTYTPNSGSTSSDNITVRVTDSSNPPLFGEVVVPVTVTVNNVPILSANPSTISTFQSTPSSTQVTFTDELDQNHTYGIEVQPSNGTAVVDTNGLLQFTPNVGFSGSDSITVSVTDDAPVPAKGTLEISINVIANTIPTITGSDTTNTFQSTSITEVYEISDPDVGQALSLSLQSPTSSEGGSVSIQPVVGQSNRYEVTYSPPAGFSGQDQFVLIGNDDANPNGVTSKVVTVDVVGNSNPVVDAQTLNFVQSDNEKSIQITFNDPDSNQTHSYSITSSAVKGVASIDQSGLFSFTPYLNETGQEIVQVSVFDDANPQGVGIGTVTINIAPNSAPQLLGPSSVTINTSTAETFSYSATDINPNQNLTYSITQNSNEVSTFIDPSNGEVQITAGELFVGTDQFEITVIDNGTPSLQDTILVTVNVERGNTRPSPTANDIFVLAGNDGSTQISPNDPDVGDTHTYMVVQQPTNGSATVDQGGLVLFTPNPGFTGFDSVSVSVMDNGIPNLGSLVSISIEVQPNTQPEPFGSSIEILAGRNESFLLDPNDPDPNQTWTYSVDVVPTFGAVSVDQSGNVDFSTDNLESGSGTFEIKVTDDGNPNLSGNAIFNYTIIENGEPIVGSDSIFVNKNTPFNGQLSWSDINQAIQTFSFSITSNPSNGSVSIDQSGNFTYTPNAEYLGADQFSVRVTDDTGLFGEGIISVTVSEGNLNPVINGVSFDVLDTSGPFKTRFILDVDDPDGDVVSGVIDFGDGRPSQVLDTSIVPEEFLNSIYHQYDSSGSYTVSLTITDNSGGTANLTAPIDVNLNSPPVANISANTFSGVAPLIVNFDASSSSDDTGINEYVWRVLETDEEYFGVSPSITFSNSGLYNVELKLKDVDSAVTFAKVQISVDQGGINQLPEFNFLSSNFQSSTFPFLVTTSISGEVDFDGTVTEIVQYSGDPLGPDMAFGNSGSFNYFKPGTYFQKAVVRDDFDEARLKERAVYVGPEEAPLIGVFPIQTGPFEVKMDSLIKGRYDKNSLIWDFGNGQFSNEIAPTHTYSASGTYLVKVYYFDVYGNYTSADREIYIDGNNYDPVIVSDLPFYQEISPGTSISFDISGSNDPGGNPLDGSVVDFKTGNLAIDTTTGSETFNDVGFYDVTVYVVNDKGMTTKESVYVNVISGDGPQPVGSVDISSGSAPLTFTLDATGSFHNSGTITDSLWKSNSLPNEFGLPIGTPNQIETLTLESPGVYDFELWVRDNLGNTRQQTISVEVTN